MSLVLWAGQPASPSLPYTTPPTNATLHCPLTSGRLSFHACPVLLGSSSQLSLGGQCSRQGQQPRGTATHQPSRTRGEGHRGGMVGQWLELLLLERRRGEPGAVRGQVPSSTPGPRGHGEWRQGLGRGDAPGVSRVAKSQASCPPSTPSFSTYWVQGPGGGVPRWQGRGQDDSPQ